jgi:hypothetical protein
MAVPSAPRATRYLKKRRFRNWKIIVIELAVALLGFYVFGVTPIREPKIPSIAGIIAGAGALWLIQLELLGISIDQETLTLPRRRIRWMPALSFRRRTVPLPEVRRLTILARWLGFEIVKIYGDFGSDMLVFGSRDQRRRFTLIMQSLCPDILIYRVR